MIPELKQIMDYEDFDDSQFVEAIQEIYQPDIEAK